MNNEIICGDCLEVMKSIPDGSIDLIASDLPYGSTSNPADRIIPFEPLWEQFKRITKPNAAIVLTATHPFAAQLIMSNLKMFRYDLVWEKNKSTGFLNAKKMPLRSHELILVFYKLLSTYNPQKTTGHKPVNSFTKLTSDGPNYGKTKQQIKGGGATDRYPRSILKIPVLNNDSPERQHPTQKPLKLFEWLLRTYSNPNDVVLDPTVGVGTTALAALNCGRRFIGIDINPEYCEKAKQRINACSIS